MTSILQELSKAASMKAPKGGPDEAWLRSLVETINAKADTDQDFWDKLSEPAQQYVNDGQLALNEGKPIPSIDDNGPAPNGNGADHQEQDDMTDKTTKKAKPAGGGGAKKAAAAKPAGDPKKKAAAPAKKAAAAKPAADKAAGPKKVSGIKVAIKMAIIKQPGISLEDLIGKLEKDGEKVSRYTTASIRSEFRHSLRVLNQAGVTKIDL